jgi:hypothetical protein
MNDILEDIRIDLDTIIKCLRDIKRCFIIEKVLEQPYDITYYIVKHAYRLYNLNKIREQRFNKVILNLQINAIGSEYRFKSSISTISSFHSAILNGSNMNRYDLLYENGELAGVKLKEVSNITLYQFMYFAKRMELFLTKEPSILIHEHEKVSLFCSTSISVFPIIYTVYEARDVVIKSGLEKSRFLDEIINYVNMKGFIIKLLRRDNAFIMSIN